MNFDLRKGAQLSNEGTIVRPPCRSMRGMCCMYRARISVAWFGFCFVSFVMGGSYVFFEVGMNFLVWYVGVKELSSFGFEHWLRDFGAVGLGE